MANEKNKKSTSTSSSAKKGTSAPAKKVKTATSTKKTQPSNKDKDKEKSAPRLTREEQLKLAQMRDDRRAAAAEKKKRFSEQYMPYVLGALGLLTLVFFASFLFGRDVAPEDYWMGPVGYWVSYFFYGLFGWPALCIPVLLIYLTFFWRKNCREDTVGLRIVLSVVLMVMVSGVVHVFACAADEQYAAMNIGMYYQSGATYASGGVIGGLLGFLLFHGLKVWGTVLISVLLFPLLIMFLIGVTPAYVASRIKAKVAASREAKEARELEEARAALAQGDEPVPAKKRVIKEAPMPEDAGSEDYVPPKPRKRSAEPVAPARKDADAATPTPASRREEAPAEPPRILRMNAETGEVLEDAEEVTARRMPSKSSAAEEEGVYIPPRRKTSAVSSEDISARATAADISQEAFTENTAPRDDGDTEVSDGQHYSAPTEGTEKEEGGDGLYIPTRRMSKDHYADRRNNRMSRNTSGFDEHDVDDTFAIDDLPEKVETLEISWDDDDDAESPDTFGYQTAVNEEKRDVAREDAEKIVVVVNRQETAAVTDTTDHHVEGLPDEEIVLPSAKGEEVQEDPREYAFPAMDLLIQGPARYEADENEIIRNTQTLRSVLESFHIRVKEIACSCGPTITRYEVKPDTGVRVRSIANLVDDIALGLAKSGVRIEAPIPGKAAVGIEVPNDKAASVALRNLIEAPEFVNSKSRLTACLGADVAGRPVMMDINKMPHLLVAGTTGSGKSVCINSIIMSILYKAKPEEVKLILIDPKKVEFAVYRDLPHLYCPLISDPKKAAGALNSAVVEMERRFELIEEVGVRNLAGYNELTAGDPERPPLPQMVIIIDELADLMMTASNEVETAICRLAQKARAAGIHLILGTQRPSVDVITGLIKANIPSRIAFTVASAVDSRTIIDMVGAEKLIGRGDMLYSPVGSTKPMRVQGAFVSDGEVERVVTFLREHNAKTEYDESFMHQIEVEAAKCGQGKKKGGDVGNIEDFSALGGDDEDGKFWAAVEVAVDSQKISTSLLQRRLNLGYGRAAKIIDRMEEMGFVGPADGNKPRKLLITKQDLAEIRISGRADEASEE